MHHFSEVPVISMLLLTIAYYTLLLYNFFSVFDKFVSGVLVRLHRRKESFLDKKRDRKARL